MVYIQSNDKRTLPHHFDACCGMYGAIENVLDYRLTTFEEVSCGKFDRLIKSNVFIGSTEFMREVFKRVGINDVRLPMNSNRSHLLMTLGEFFNKKVDKHYFIKPVEIKLFTGFVYDGCNYPSIQSLPNDTKIYVYEVLPKILSEWRIYVYRNRLTDSCFYSGNFRITPNYDWIDELIKVNKELIDPFPDTYVIDVGILENGEMTVIEYNDMWAIGNYGVPNDIYYSMLKERYFDIIRNHDNR